MLQQVEYESHQFISWTNRWPNYARVTYRQKLVLTGKAKALLAIAYLAWIACVAGIIALIVSGYYLWAFLLVVCTPGFVQISLLIVTNIGAPALKMKRAKLLKAAEAKMAAHKGVKIAVLGSYGKTTAKEVLATVLAEGKTVAVTPGNKNVSISHARWIMNTLTGDEDVVIFEYGEFRTGDIAAFATMTHPDAAVLTGYAPNHLDSYGSELALQLDLISIENFVAPDKLLVSGQAAKALPFKQKDFRVYDEKSVLDWKITHAQTGFEGTQFTMQHSGKKLDIHSQLLGLQTVPVLAMTAAFAHELGLKNSQIQDGIAKTRPFEHRMEPRALNGAWIIDDTYNGNIEGMRAGLELLAELPAKKRIFVTPGLVEQGEQTEAVHKELGSLIAKAKPDQLILMQNSVTSTILNSLKDGGYKGEIKIESEPLQFYENLSYFLAAGDVILMQNDWTDNYN